VILALTSALSVGLAGIIIIAILLIRPAEKRIIKLKDVERKTNELLSFVTHELRSPLTSIHMYIDLFFAGQAGILTNVQKEFLTIMKNSTDRLAGFINDFLDLSKIEQGKMSINIQVFDLQKLILEMLEPFRAQAFDKKISIKYLISHNLPKVNGDPERTKQVVVNLVSNSIKFTPDNGTITVELEDIKVGYVRVGISDTGIGIPKDKLNSVFEKFVQLTDAKKTVKGQKGTGLGLAIAKGIVEAQGGKIWVESEHGKGTKFYFTMPKYG
jgi:signal transduction histidine kinase